MLLIGEIECEHEMISTYSSSVTEPQSKTGLETKQSEI